MHNHSPKSFLFIKADAIASPKDAATAALAVGTSPNGSASMVTDASSAISTFSASLLSTFPKIPTICAFLFLILVQEKELGVDPLLDRKITGSPFGEYPDLHELPLLDVKNMKVMLVKVGCRNFS